LTNESGRRFGRPSDFLVDRLCQRIRTCLLVRLSEFLVQPVGSAIDYLPRLANESGRRLGRPSDFLVNRLDQRTRTRLLACPSEFLVQSEVKCTHRVQVARSHFRLANESGRRFGRPSDFLVDRLTNESGRAFWCVSRNSWSTFGRWL